MNLDPTYRYSASATLQKEFGSPLELAPIDDWLLHLTLGLIRRTDLEWAWAVLN